MQGIYKIVNRINNKIYVGMSSDIEKRWKQHKHNTGQKGSQNGKAKLTEEDVYNIRMRKKNGEPRKKVYENYSHILTSAGFDSIWYGYNWKHVIV